MEKKDQFLFLYPISEYFDWEIKNNATSFYPAKLSQARLEEFWRRLSWASDKQEERAVREGVNQQSYEKFYFAYRSAFNSCVDRRYRQDGFGINWVVFKGSEVSSVVDLIAGDRILEADVSYEVHVKEKRYANTDFILDQLDQKSLGHLRVAGFHMFDCVEKLAKRAHERKMDILVDEDLTNFFSSIMKSVPHARVGCYPSHHPEDFPNRRLSEFMRPRKGKPWYWQKY